MPEKLKTSAEVVFCIVTMASTMPIPWGLIGLKVVVGFLTYFGSRMVYRYYKKDIDAFVDSIKKNKQK